MRVIIINCESSFKWKIKILILGIFIFVVVQIIRKDLSVLSFFFWKKKKRKKVVLKMKHQTGDPGGHALVYIDEKTAANIVE